MGLAAREYIQRKYTIEHGFAQWMNVISACLDGVNQPDLFRGWRPVES